MQRYNFHVELAKCKADPKGYRLPEDINDSVYAFLDRLGCVPGKEKLREYQRTLRYGIIEIVSDDTPQVKYTIQVDCGIASLYKKAVISKYGKWNFHDYYTVKNKRLDKTKQKD